MNVLNSRRIVSLSALLMTLNVGTPSGASSMFTVTPLGSTYGFQNVYSLQQDESGAVHSVTSGDGSRSYVFEKSPVTYYSGADHYDSSGNHISASNGAGTLGYSVTSYGGFRIPFSTAYHVGWTADGYGNPSTDLNASGEIVGLNVPSSGTGWPSAAFATFSAEHLMNHPGASRYTTTTDNLNNYISSDLGVYLREALKVDDSGQIIAHGTLNGEEQDFLLTPNGPPTPTPEPSTLAVLAVGLAAFAVRSVHRRRG